MTTAHTPELDLTGKTVLFTERRGYAGRRVLAFALGAQGAYDKMMATVSVIVHAGPRPPEKAAAKYPRGAFYSEEEFAARTQARLGSFPQLVQALIAHGFRFRNPSDEADEQLDVFEQPAAATGLKDSLLEYVRRSPFVASYVRAPWGKMPETPDPAFKPIEIPSRDVTWWYAFGSAAIEHIQAERGEGEYPQKIKGSDLFEAGSMLWREGTGARLYETPEDESIAGLFLMAGIERHTGQLTGLALSRTWT
ncbi:MAG: hypothetical protein U1A78_19405 [Polyangia bacterium]